MAVVEEEVIEQERSDIGEIGGGGDSQREGQSKGRDRSHWCPRPTIKLPRRTTIQNGKRREATTNTNEHIPIRLSRQQDRMGGNISRDGDTRQRQGQGLSYLLAHGGSKGIERLTEGGH